MESLTARAKWCLTINSSKNARPNRNKIAAYQGPATTRQATPIHSKSRNRFARYNHHTNGKNNTNGSKPLASTANPRNTPANQAGPPNTTSSRHTVKCAVNGTSVTPTLPKPNQPTVPASRIEECNAMPLPNRDLKYRYRKPTNPKAVNATGNRGAVSGPNPISAPSPVIQYNKAGFSNHGCPHSRVVTQSPDRAISTPIAA